MSRVVFGGLALAALLVGCATGSELTTVLFKPGVSEAVKQADLDNCKIAAYKNVPQAVQTNITPGYSNLGTISCNTYGYTTSCNRAGAWDISPTVTTVDANDDLRRRVRDRCLEAKGYRLLNLKRCTTSEQIAYLKAHPNEVPTCTLGQMLQ